MQSCEGPLTPGECWTAISQMANNKSPGSDGLPAEFYKEFFPQFGPLFINIANAQLAKPLSFLNVLASSPFFQKRYRQIPVEQLATSLFAQHGL
jgi:hypothetical protein